MGIWTIRKTFRFEAAHRLPNHNGKCARLHGHSWVMHVGVSSNRIQTNGAQKGMVIDFGVLKGMLTPIVEEFLDHHYLNETIPGLYPTSEELARWVYEKITFDLESQHEITLRYVEIEETCTSGCRYENTYKKRGSNEGLFGTG